MHLTDSISNEYVLLGVRGSERESNDGYMRISKNDYIKTPSSVLGF
jgi:hypothetical protein